MRRASDGRRARRGARTLRRVLACLALLAAGSAAGIGAAAGEAPRFRPPVACPAGAGCFIQNHVDRDAGSGFRDYRCGALSYDGHRGTDFRVRDLKAMADGVPVVAAAEGTVARVRDGYPDRVADALGDRADLPKDGGNVVTVDHGDGWTTAYAHLREGSIAVRPGERVAKGQRLGVIGLSGRTEFPHVHFEIRRNGRAIDPFAPEAAGAGVAGPAADCAPPAVTLWDDPAAPELAYSAPGALGRGFAPRAPSLASVLRDACQPEGVWQEDSPALVSWTQFVGLAAGDVVVVRLRAPGGRVVAESITPHKGSKAIWLGYAGIRRPAAGWPAGRFVAEAAVHRGGREVWREEWPACLAAGDTESCKGERMSCEGR